MTGKEYGDYIQDILDSITDIDEFTEGMSFEEFLSDKKTVNAVIRSLEVIGEAAKKIPDTLRDKSQDIPWKKIAGMRDKLIHEYFGVDLDIVWKTIQDEMPSLRDAVEALQRDIGP